MVDMAKKKHGSYDFLVNRRRLEEVTVELEVLAAEARSILKLMEKHGFNGEFMVHGGERVWEAVMVVLDKEGKPGPSRIQAWLAKVGLKLKSSAEFREKRVDADLRKK